MPDAPAALSAPAADWLYYRIRVPAADAGDRLLTELVHPILEQLRADVRPGAGLRWFFLRFFDATGMHVRLRINAEHRPLAQAERILDKALNDVIRQESSACSSYGKYIYVPETEKFGNGYGTLLAEEIFQRSSEMALDFLTSDSTAHRVGYAAAHMADMLAGLPEPQRLAFLHQYAWYWSGGPNRRHVPRRSADGPAQDRLHQQAEKVLGQVRQVLSTPAVADGLRQYGTWFRAAVNESGHHGRTRSDFFLLFHHIHLTNNRLGVFPAAESAIARLLWFTIRTRGPRGNMTDVIR